MRIALPRRKTEAKEVNVVWLEKPNATRGKRPSGPLRRLGATVRHREEMYECTRSGRYCLRHVGRIERTRGERHLFLGEDFTISDQTLQR